MLLPTNNNKRYLIGTMQIAPPVQHRLLSWSLSKVLPVLMRPPFEPLYTIDPKHFIWKVVFSVAVTSSWRVSELGALSIQKKLSTFFSRLSGVKIRSSFLAQD